MFGNCKNETLKCPDGILFTVRVSDDIQYSFEEIALTGDHPLLGAWNSHLAIVMDQCTDDPKMWMTKVQLPIGIVVHYRYFITAMDCETAENSHVGEKQIHRWETGVNARSYKVLYRVPKPTDTFGVIDGAEKEVSLGWLTYNLLVQFVFGHFAIRMTAEDFQNSSYNFKIQLLNATTLQRIAARPKAYMEYTRLSYGESPPQLLPQPDGGIPYNAKTIVVFQSSVCDLPKVMHELQLITPGGYILGYQRVTPTMLQRSEGQLELEILSRETSQPVGTVSLRFLVIKPTRRTRYAFQPTIPKWLDIDECIDVGHRGLGQSMKVVQNIAPLVENTIGSLNFAASVGADMVELDIGLTKDRVPVICHDFHINIFKRNIGRPRTPEDLMQVCIDRLTYEELKELKTYHYIDRVMRKHDAYNELRESEKDRRLFVALQDMFEQVDPSVGFDLDIKWPQRLANGVDEAPTNHDKNLFVDCILQVVERCRKNRFVIITCFDAGICAMMRFKQNIIPVMFLSSDLMLLSREGPEYADDIAQTVSATIHYAQAFDLAGIVPHASWVAYDSRLILLAHKAGLRVLIWGNVLKDDKTIKNFKRLQLDGLIYDRIDLWCIRKQNNTNGKILNMRRSTHKLEKITYKHA